MYFALDENRNRIDIKSAERGKVYYCPICDKPLEQKRGDVRCHHFAHKRSFDSHSGGWCDSWHYDMTPWHLEWQKRFPEECREKVFQHNGSKHIADVSIHNLVVEFQHSTISVEEFRDRNAFYKRCGKSVIWVFDLIDEMAENKLTWDDEADNRLLWNYPRKLFKELDYKSEGVEIYFQIADSDDVEDYVLLRITGLYRNGTNVYEDSNHSLTIPLFVDYVMNRPERILAMRNRKLVTVAKDVPNGKTIFELWNIQYKWMIVRNLSSGAVMCISGKDGQMLRQNNRPDGHIVGRYSNKDSEGKFVYGNELKVVWDADRPIWGLIKAKNMPEELLSIINARYIPGCSNLVTLINQSADKNIFRCRYNDKIYLLEFVGKRHEMRFNSYELDPKTGALSDYSQNAIVWRLRNKNVWEYYEEDTDQ